MKKSEWKVIICIASLILWCDRIALRVHLWRERGLLLARLLRCGLLSNCLLIRGLCGLICLHWLTNQHEVIHAHIVVHSSVVLTGRMTESDTCNGTYYDVGHLVRVECFKIDAIKPRVCIVLLILEDESLRLPLITCSLTDTLTRWQHFNDLACKFHNLIMLLIIHFCVRKLAEAADIFQLSWCH